MSALFGNIVIPVPHEIQAMFALNVLNTKVNVNVKSNANARSRAKARARAKAKARAKDPVEYVDIMGNPVEPTSLVLLKYDAQKCMVLASILDSDPPIHILINAILASGLHTLATDIKKYVDDKIGSIKCDIYSWYRLSYLTDYELHRHLKCNWPVLPAHDPKWIARAVELGVPIGRLVNMIGAEYPGEKPNESGVRDAGFVATDLQQMINKYAAQRNDERRDVNRPRPPDAANRNVRDAKYESRKEWLMENTTYGHYEKITANCVEVMTSEQVMNIFAMYMNIGSVDYAVLLVANLMASTKTAHVAIKNPPLMRALTNVMNDYPKLKPFIASHAMVYAFRTTYMEERMVGQNIKRDNRAWWSEEQFLALPVFNYMPHMSPYCPVISGNLSIYAQLLYYAVGQRRFTTRDEYLERVRYGSRYQGESVGVASAHDVIPYSKWTNPGADSDQSILALSGGFHHACCGIKPIEQNYDGWVEYMDYVYPGYESISGLVSEFYDNAHKLLCSAGIVLDNPWDRDTIVSELTKFTKGHSNDLSHVYESCNNGKLAVREEEKEFEDTDAAIDTHDIQLPIELSDLIALNTRIDEFVTGLSDMDVSVHCITHVEYIRVVESTYQALKDAGYKRIWLRKVPRKWNFKYAIMGPDLTRPIDMYRVDIMDIQLMRKFHLDPVRILWNGTTRWALSSSVGFHLTGVVSTMIWLSNNKDPIDLIMSYAVRGCSKFMNKPMGDIMRKALENDDMFSKYPIVFGPVAHNHGIFVDKLIARNSNENGKKIMVNNSKLPWPQEYGHKWHDGMRVIVPDINSFRGHINNALLN